MTRARAASCAAALVAVAALVAAIRYGSTVGGGADSYGYVSQAALWRSGQLTLREPIARESPWPLALNTWAPLGYVPAPGSRDTIVPLYAPGLPLLMAAFQAVGGFCAAFLVVPFCGALTVWLTWRLGGRLGVSHGASLAAVILLASSPVFLYQLMNPMSDVPATAAWTLATVLITGGSMAAGGLAAAAALLIRPNLVLIGVALTAWILVTRQPAVRFLLGLAPAVLAIAVLNTTLYGAPWTSGYGPAADLYSPRFVWTNLRQFGAWMVQTQTPIVALAVLPLGLPRWWPASGAPHGRLLAGSFVAAVWLSYLLYIPFDAWWYLRFLLPMWPILLLLVALAGERIVGVAARRWARPSALEALAAVAVVTLAVNGIRIAAARSTFELSRGERRYVDVARFAAAHTDPDAVLISLQHSGSLRLYAGRMTLRFDQLDPLWLDRVVEFLRGRGRHPFIVLDRGELDLFKRQFAESKVGRLDWAPMAALDESAFVYDATPQSSAAGPPLAIAASASRRSGWRCEESSAHLRAALRTE
jgi:hypothetical protein